MYAQAALAILGSFLLTYGVPLFIFFSAGEKHNGKE
jgi:hypothetical protein